jgi:hypothetical protein
MRPVSVTVSDRIATPMIYCLGRPRLLWPSSLVGPQVVADFDALLAHELAHVARRDHLTALFELVVTVACWWNPLVWFLRRQLREARELACDAIALAQPKQPRSAYARLLLSLATSSPASMLATPAFGGGAVSRRFLRRRLTMVFDHRTSGRVDRRGAAVVLLLAGLALPGLTLAEPPATGPSVSPLAPSDSDSPPVEATRPSTGSDSRLPELPQTAPLSPRSNGQTVEVVGQLDAGTTPSTVQAHTRLRPEELTPGKWTDLSFPFGPSGVRIMRNEDGSLVVSIERRVPFALGQQSFALDGSYPLTRGWYKVAPDEPSGPPRADFDAEMLRTDLELAQVSLAEKKTELDLLQGEKAPAGKLRLAELSVRRAQIELQRCQLKLRHAGSVPVGQ